MVRKKVLGSLLHFFFFFGLGEQTVLQLLLDEILTEYQRTITECG